MAKHEIDLGLLLWTIERGAKPEAFGPGRTVVQLCLTDQIAKKRHWWVLNESGRCELCLEIPDQNVDLFLEATLPDMIYVCQGDLTLAQALDTRRLRAHGTGTAGKALGPLAQHQSARPCAIGKSRRARPGPMTVKRANSQTS